MEGYGLLILVFIVKFLTCIDCCILLMAAKKLYLDGEKLWRDTIEKHCKLCYINRLGSSTLGSSSSHVFPCNCTHYNPHFSIGDLNNLDSFFISFLFFDVHIFLKFPPIRPLYVES